MHCERQEKAGLVLVVLSNITATLLGLYAFCTGIYKRIICSFCFARPILSATASGMPYTHTHTTKKKTAPSQCRSTTLTCCPHQPFSWAQHYATRRAVSVVDRIVALYCPPFYQFKRCASVYGSSLEPIPTASESSQLSSAQGYINTVIHKLLTCPFDSHSVWHHVYTDDSAQLNCIFTDSDHVWIHRLVPQKCFLINLIIMLTWSHCSMFWDVKWASVCYPTKFIHVWPCSSTLYS